MNINFGISLHPWQSDCLKQIQQFPHDIHVVRSKRQCGKSILAEVLILKTALEKNNSASMFVSPTFRQAKKVFEELANPIKKAPFVQAINYQDFIIKFVNGSSIQFFSGEMRIEALQGYSTTGVLVIDECAFLPDDVYYTILPWTNVAKTPVVCISTPRYKTGFFYELFQDAYNGSKSVHLFDFNSYDTSALLSAERLEYYRKKLPSDQFTQMFLGEFTESSGGVFGSFGHIFYTDLPDTQKDLPCVFGIDWGSGVGGDDTAIAIMNMNGWVYDVIHFNDLDEKETINTICALVEEYNPTKLVVEKNSIGAVFLSLLRKRVSDIPIVGFTTTNENKHEMVSKFQVLIQNDEIKLPKDDALMVQMMNYEMKLSATNKPTYNAKRGFHDDIIMSILLAISGISKNKKTSFVLD